MPPAAPIHPWENATSSWVRVDLGFAEPLMEMFLIIFDSYSKWIEAYPMSGIKTSLTL